MSDKRVGCWTLRRRQGKEQEQKKQPVKVIRQEASKELGSRRNQGEKNIQIKDDPEHETREGKERGTAEIRNEERSRIRKSSDKIRRNVKGKKRLGIQTPKRQKPN